MSQVPTATLRISPKTYDFSQFNGDWYSGTRSALPCYNELYTFEGSLSNTMMAPYAFAKMRYLRMIKLTDTGRVMDMNHMFDGDSRLLSVDLSDADTSYVNDMSGMFNGCSNITALDLSSFNTENLMSANEMFYGCSKLESLDLSM